MKRLFRRKNCVHIHGRKGWDKIVADVNGIIWIEWKDVLGAQCPKCGINLKTTKALIPAWSIYTMSYMDRLCVDCFTKRWKVTPDFGKSE